MQKPAYEMRISDGSSDVCSSDLVAGLVGANLQVAFQVPWVIALFALLFVALALSSFGLYELQLPAALRSKLGRFSDRQRGGSLAGVAAMGALSALDRKSTRLNSVTNAHLVWRLLLEKKKNSDKSRSERTVRGRK